MRTVTCTEDRECYISKMDTSIRGQDPTFLIPMETIRGKSNKMDKQEGFGQRKKRVSRSATAKQSAAPVKAPLKKTIRKKPTTKKSTDKKAKAKKATVKKAISKTPKCVPCKPKVVKKKAKKVTKKKKDC